MEIKSISQKIFRTNSTSTENRSNHTNPFGVNFKGNMINADVFDVSFAGAKETLAQKAANKISSVRNKMADAMNVGSINSFVSSKVKSVVDFGKRIGEGASKLWNEAKSYEINLPIYDKVYGKVRDERVYSLGALNAKDSLPLGDMLKSVLATA